MKESTKFNLYILFMMVFSSGCGALSTTVVPEETPTSVSVSSSIENESISTIVISEPTLTQTVIVNNHLIQPADTVPAPASFVDDVESSGTAAEGRAPYGDSLDLNRFERPFLEDMTYIPDLDINKFGLSRDDNWYYISVQLIGADPNNTLGINYGVEIDQNADGYGDYIIWAHPPYASAWDTGTVQVFMDTNKDTGGLSVTRSEDVHQGDGYDKLVFDGAAGLNDDPDLAWVRMLEGQNATIQFAFKRSWAGNSFMFGVVADAGLKDVSMFDYADRFTEVQAGSSVRGRENYPLGLLYAVDNTCWEAYGFTSTGFEPKVCPAILQPVIKPSGNDQPSGCNPPPNCGGGPYDPVTCACQ